MSNIIIFGNYFPEKNNLKVGGFAEKTHTKLLPT